MSRVLVRRGVVVAMPRLWAGRRQHEMSRRLTGAISIRAHDQPHVFAGGQLPANSRVFGVGAMDGLCAGRRRTLGRLRWMFVLGVALALLAQPAAPASASSAAASFTSAASMGHARAFQTSTVLLNGDVLVAGGYDGSVFFTGLGPPVFPDAEIYDRHAGTWANVASMHVARAAAVAVRLPDGRVMVVGGFDSSFNGIDSAEIYDPGTNTWSLTGPLHSRRAEDFVATLLPGGGVLIAGGYLRGFPFIPLSSSEIWNPRTNEWSIAAPMNVPRGEAAWTSLKDGRVLTTGGVDTIDEVGGPTNSAEIFDPTTGTWTLTGSMHVGREDHSAVLLLDGNVLVAGGETGGGVRTPTAELYDPRTGTWSLTGSMTAPRSESEWATVLLPNGNVLDAGGFAAEETPQSSADVYDTSTGTWSSAGQMSNSRAGHTAVVLRGNRGVLVMGGLVVPPSSTVSVDIYR
jgi:hypothetical protein